MMHEHSLTSGLIHKIESLAREHHSGRVVSVTIALGALSNISAGHFREHFVAAARGTIAGDALLTIRQESDIGSVNAQQIMLESVEFEE